MMKVLSRLKNLNLFKIHDENEDDTPLTWIRVNLSSELYKRFRKFVSSTSNDLETNETGLRKHLIKYLPQKVSLDTTRKRFKPNSNVPLVAILSLLKLRREKLRETKKEQLSIINDLVQNMNLFCSSRGSRKVRLPSNISPDLLYFIGVISGDGSLPRAHKGPDRWEYPIEIEKANRAFLEEVYIPLMKKLFNLSISLKSRKRANRQRTWTCKIGSKPLYRYLTRICGLPEGKKGARLRIPKVVKMLKPKERIPYLTGLVDTDFGSLGRGMGITTASPVLADDLEYLLSSLDISVWRANYKKEEFKQVVAQGKSCEHLKRLIMNVYPFKNPKRQKLFQSTRG